MRPLPIGNGCTRKYYPLAMNGLAGAADYGDWVL